MLQFCHNLPLLIRVHTTFYHAARINVSRNAFLNSCTEEKNIFFDVHRGKNKSKCGFVVCTLIINVCTLFLNNVFSLLLHVERVCTEIFERKADAYKQLICIMQRVHFQVGVAVFVFVNKSQQRFLLLSLILWYKTNRMWLSVVCILIDNNTGHHSRQDLL